MTTTSKTTYKCANPECESRIARKGGVCGLRCLARVLALQAKEKLKEKTGRDIDLASGLAGPKWKPGVEKIIEGKCERGMSRPIDCIFCMQGHMMECHYPKTCQEAQCSHLKLAKHG